MICLLIVDDKGKSKIKQKILKISSKGSEIHLYIIFFYATQLQFVFSKCHRELLDELDVGTHLLHKDDWKCHITSFPLANSSYAKPSIVGTQIVNSPLNSSKVNNAQSGQVQCKWLLFKNIYVMLRRPGPRKCKRGLIYIQLPASR